jgi:polar amino acid transport system ATP-binding protein
MNGGSVEPLLKVIDLHKSFGANEVIRGVDLEVNAGETITIIGPSGSGKTTLLRCINYLERPTSGHVYIGDRLVGENWNGKDFRHVGDRELAKERTEMGMVFQRFNLWPHLTALGNVTLGPIRVLKKPAEQARAEGLTRRKNIRNASLVASSSGWPSRAPWPCSQNSSSSTSRLPPSTPN